jgi:hypothetical protein
MCKYSYFNPFRILSFLPPLMFLSSTANAVELGELEYLLNGKTVHQEEAQRVLRSLAPEEQAANEKINQARALYEGLRLPENVTRQSVLSKVLGLNASRARMRAQYNRFHEYLVLQTALLKNEEASLRSQIPQGLAAPMKNAVQSEINRVMAQVNLPEVMEPLLREKMVAQQGLDQLRRDCNQFRESVGSYISLHLKNVSRILTIKDGASSSSGSEDSENTNQP